MTKRVLYPITMDVNFYLINQDGQAAVVTIGMMSGVLPTHDIIVEKLNEQITAMQGDGKGLHGSFRACTYEEVSNAKLEMVDPVAASHGPYAFIFPEDAVWYTDLETCGCADHKPTEPNINKELFWKLESDSLDAIVEVVGEGKEFQQYNKGKSQMRDWFLSKLSSAFGMNWKASD